MLLVKRRWGHHLWLFFIPLAVIFLLSVLVLFVGLYDTAEGCRAAEGGGAVEDGMYLSAGDRFAATSALLFAAIQIKSQVASLLPRLHLLTLLDKVNLFVIIMLSGAASASFGPLRTRVRLIYAIFAFGVLTGGPLLYAIWHRLAKKVGQFAKATKIVFTRRKAEAEAEALSWWELVWHRNVWRLLLCKMPTGFKSRSSHQNVPDDQDRDELIDKSWPKREEFEEEKVKR